MMDWKRDEVAALLLEAGRCALRHYETPRRQVKNDGTLVTQADQEIEALLARYLDRPEEGFYLLGEETEGSRSESYLAAALKETAYVVDPIDGTACYAHHVPIWGISLGRMRKGVLDEGAVYMPVTGELFISEGPHVYLAEAAATADAGSLTWEELTPPTAGPFRATGLIALTQDLGKSGGLSLPNPVHVLACAVVPLTYLLLGRYEAYIGYLKVWDLAGGLPLLLKLGFAATLLDGRVLDGRVDEEYYCLGPQEGQRWKLRKPCLFARPGIDAELLPRIPV